MLSLPSPSQSSSLSFLRLFLPTISFRSDSCRSLGFRSKGVRSPAARPCPSGALFSLHPSSPGRKHQFSDPEDQEDEDEVEEDEEDDEYVTTEEYVNGVLQSGDVSEDVDEYAESEGEGEARPSDGFSSQYTDHKWQRVEKLITEVREFGEEIIDFDELAGVYDFPIDKFQRLAIQAFLRGSSVVVSAPTSSGKTLIAEASAIATVAKGRRLFYTTPLKALSNQKYREFRKSFGEDRVGLLTGDSAINKDASILIMTTEILRNMMYQSVGMVSSGSKLFNVDVVVLDEVHYLSDISRGTVWEEIVIYCPKSVQLICLSATVANPDELAGWIGQIHGKTELVASTKRPVPLLWHFSLKTSLLPLLDEKGTKINRKLSIDSLHPSPSKVDTHNENKTRKYKLNKTEQSFSRISGVSRKTLSKNVINNIRRSQVPQIRDTLKHLRVKDMLPAIWFIFSRRGCDAAVQYLEDCMLLDDCEASEVELELQRLRVQYPDAIREGAVKGLLQGIAAHHAGCLPLWKSFVEELFQRGLVKVVFATETLAAGINMPARTAIISSLTKRGESGRTLLSSNELLQMAGRAGRRGIDAVGHVVLVQTPYEGAEESCELLFTGLEPLVSQFTASYGMVLNLLAGAKVTRIGANRSANLKVSSTGRTLEEARKLVEQSFGNYVGSNVMLAAKEELTRIRKEIELLSQEVTDEAVDRKCQEQLLEAEYAEISNLQEELRAEKRLRTERRQKMELKRMAAWKPLLDELGSEQLPFICLQYKDNDSVQHFVTGVYMGKFLLYPDDSNIDTSKPNFAYPEDQDSSKLTYYVALGSDNSWYLFTEKWIKMIYKVGLPNVSLAYGEALPRKILRGLLMKEELTWGKLAESEFGSLWISEGSLETWSWSLNVPVLSSLSEDDEVRNWSEEYQDAIDCYREQRTKVSRLKKKLTNTKGFKEFKRILDLVNFNKEKIERLETRSHRLTKRIEQIEPSGWKEFLQISKVIQETRALDVSTRVMYPLGETASAIRGENELWLAMVLRNKILLDLKPAQLAAILGSLVSDGIKVRPWKSNCYVYEPSSIVVDVVEILEEQRISLLQIQDKYGVKIACGLDSQFSGMVEAWASGLTWREIMMDCAMDEGDLARLFRRTIDLLAQIPKLPDIDPVVQNNALAAANFMDRAPISEFG